MLFSEAHGQRVISTTTAETVGHVGALVIDPAAQRVVALSLKRTPVSGTLLPWADVMAFGVDAVTVSSQAQIVEEQGRFAELNSKAHVILKKRVLNTAGLQVGTVRDVDFDPADGRILSILTDDEPIDGRALLGVGSYAVVVQA